ncbi:aspartic peptidase A1 [Mucidula mucida]|nr:aspartic peptidase A1 [Mucidula mucida]
MQLVSTAFFAALLFVVNANPVVVSRSPVTLPVARKFNLGNGTTTLLQRDQARAASLKARAQSFTDGGETSKRAIINEDVDNVAVLYTASIGVGSPATNCIIVDELLIDTGSSNTWVGAGTAYKTTSTSTKTSNSVSVTYGSGSFSGTEYTDQVTIANGLVISKQSIGVASQSSGFDGFDGILGIGPVDLTQGTLSPASSTLIPTVTDNLFSQGTITGNEIGIFFAPTTSTETENGVLSWGGVDTSKLTSDVSYTSVTSTSPAKFYWGIDESVTYGTSTTILSSTAGIVDTGTTLVLLATDAYNRYLSATGATLDSTTGLLRITTAQFSNLKSLFFNIGGKSYELTANAQIWPRSLNSAIGGSASNIYLIVADLGSNSGEGLDFINGYTFLERFYSVYDTANSRIGFATTSSTTATSN